MEFDIIIWILYLDKIQQKYEQLFKIIKKYEEVTVIFWKKSSRE